MLTKEELVKQIEDIDEELNKNQKVGAYNPTTSLLIVNKQILENLLWSQYGVFYTKQKEGQTL